MPIVVVSKDLISIVKEQDVVPFRNRVKEYAINIKMGIVKETKLITAASELVRNMLTYGKGGIASIEVIMKESDTGIRLTFADKGPGIEDIVLALKDGYSSSKSLGMGLPGARRLVSEFEIQSNVGEGTTITIIEWKNG